MQLSDIHSKDPYKGFPYVLYPKNVVGWGSEAPGFEEVILRTDPKLIIEVGSWFGASALHMAALCDAQIVCVDTWLGSTEFWLDQTDETRYRALGLEYGYPTAYHQFLANVCYLGRQQQIIPFPQTSANAARVFAAKNVTADLIYIDGSHDLPDVYEDIEAYWPLVRKGGIMFGDDLDTFLDVNRAVALFEKKYNVKHERIERQWIITKGGK